MRGFNRRDAKDTEVAAHVVHLAQQTAAQAVADAQREAEEKLNRARQEAQQIPERPRARSLSSRVWLARMWRGTSVYPVLSTGADDLAVEDRRKNPDK